MIPTRVAWEFFVCKVTEPDNQAPQTVDKPYFGI